VMSGLRQRMTHETRRADRKIKPRVMVHPRRSEACVVEFDGHDLNARVSGAGQSRPITDASPGSQRSSGRRLFRRASAHADVNTHAPFPTESQSFLRASAVMKQRVSRDPVLAGGAFNATNGTLYSSYSSSLRQQR
jgi:hypothetical protein